MLELNRFFKSHTNVKEQKEKNVLQRSTFQDQDQLLHMDAKDHV